MTFSVLVEGNIEDMEFQSLDEEWLRQRMRAVIAVHDELQQALVDRHGQQSRSSGSQEAEGNSRISPSGTASWWHECGKRAASSNF